MVRVARQRRNSGSDHLHGRGAQQIRTIRRVLHGPAIFLPQQSETDSHRPIGCDHSSIRESGDSLELEFYPSGIALDFNSVEFKAVDDFDWAIESGALLQLGSARVTQPHECRTYLFLGGLANLFLGWRTSSSDHRVGNPI